MVTVIFSLLGMQRKTGETGNMKIFCKACGIHFPQDFDLTFISPCNYWGDLGMTNIPPVLKRKFWDWLFQMPSDELSGYGIGIGVQFLVGVVEDYNKFENMVPEWPTMTEEQRQSFQRKYFKELKK